MSARDTRSPTWGTRSGDDHGLASAVCCAWCGVELGSDAVRLPGRVRCPQCGAYTTDPVPSDADLGEAYDSWYRPRGGRFSGPSDALLRRSRAWLAGRVDRAAPPGPILDVGAGDGALLDALRERGRVAIGTERASSRPDVREAEITEIDGEWAAVVMWHTLEHLRDAGEAIGHAAALLKARGVLVIAIPNPASLQARLFGDRWLALDLPRHLVHVPASALLDRLEMLGLRAERVGYLRGGQVVFGWLHGLVGSLPGRPDLYDAIRRPVARRQGMSPARRAVILMSATLLLPVAALAATVEAARRQGGTVYVEARRVWERTSQGRRRDAGAERRENDHKHGRDDPPGARRRGDRDR